MGRQARLNAERRKLEFREREYFENDEKKPRILRLVIARGKGKGHGNGSIYHELEIDFEHRCVNLDMFNSSEEIWRIHSMELIVY